MELISSNLQHSICQLFKVVADERGVQRVITPLEYPSSGDQVVIRVRPMESGFQIDENGDSALYAAMAGGDIDSDAVSRWSEELMSFSPVQMQDDDVLSAWAPTEKHIAPYIIRVAEAAQQLHAIATSKAERKTSDFKTRLEKIVWSSALNHSRVIRKDEILPIAGGLEADHYLESEIPVIIIAASSPARLLEAEVIFMQYRAEKRPGRVIAIAESQASVGKKQFERAGYYTDRAVAFDEAAVGTMLDREFDSNAY
jgi:hypothetical protein